MTDDVRRGQVGGLIGVASAEGIRPEMVDRYCALHADPWPEVLAANRATQLFQLPAEGKQFAALL